jgi:hypothetical protein
MLLYLKKKVFPAELIAELMAPLSPQMTKGAGYLLGLQLHTHWCQIFKSLH